MDEIQPQVSKKTTIIIGIGIAVVVMIAMVTYWMYPTHEYTKAFAVPKIVTAYLDEEPFMRTTLGPNESYRPIDLMATTDPKLSCEVVSISKEKKFVVNAFDKKMESKDCEFRIQVPNMIGHKTNIVLQFFDGDMTKPTDVMEIPVKIIEYWEGIDFHGIEDEHHKTITQVSVPEKVFVYAKAVTRLSETNPFEKPEMKRILQTLTPLLEFLRNLGIKGGAFDVEKIRDLGVVKDYVALFFVADPIRGIPVLQMSPVIEGKEEIKPLVGQIVRHRRFGSKLDSYVFWTPSPISLAIDKVHRGVSDVYVGIFEKSKLLDIVNKLVSVKKTSEDSISVTPVVTDIEQVRLLTYQQRFLSPPLHLVRGGTMVEVHTSQ